MKITFLEKKNSIYFSLGWYCLVQYIRNCPNPEILILINKIGTYEPKLKNIGLSNTRPISP